jgi:hypothetical protein
MQQARRDKRIERRTSVSDHEKPKQPRPGRVEERGVVSDVVVPIVQSLVGGAVGGATGAAVTKKLGGQSQPPPKDD